MAKSSNGQTYGRVYEVISELLTEELLSAIKRVFGARREIFNKMLELYRIFLEPNYEQEGLPSAMKLVSLYYDFLNNDPSAGAFKQMMLEYPASSTVVTETAREVVLALEGLQVQYLRKKKKDKNLKFSSSSISFRTADDDHQNCTMRNMGGKKPTTPFIIVDEHTIRFDAGEIVVKKKRTGEEKITKKHFYVYLTVTESLADKIQQINNGLLKTSILTVKLEKGRLTASVVYERLNQPSRYQTPPQGSKIAIDLGVRKPVAYFDGQTYGEIEFNTKEAIRTEKRIRNYQKQLSRMDPTSKNYQKKLAQLRKAKRHAAACRREVVEIATKFFVEHAETIIYDPFSFLAFIGKHFGKNLNRKLYVSMTYFFKKRLMEKARENGVKVFEVGHGTRTTKKCPICGEEHSVFITSDRVFHCSMCGHTQDRDQNAARNIYNLPSSSLIRKV